MIFNTDVEKELDANRAAFEQSLLAVSNCSFGHRQLNLAKKAIKLASNSSTGYFSSNVIERVYLRYSQEHACGNLDKDFLENSTLHVMRMLLNWRAYESC